METQARCKRNNKGEQDQGSRSGTAKGSEEHAHCHALIPGFLDVKCLVMHEHPQDHPGTLLGIDVQSGETTWF